MRIDSGFQILVFMVLSFLLLIFFLGGEPNCSTKECYDYKIQEQKLEQEKIQADKLYQLELEKTQAIIENSKPTEVRVAEIEASQPTLGESAAIVVGTAAASYAGLKALDYLFSE